MASLGSLRLPIPLSVFVPCFLLAFVMYAECSYESQSGNMTDFEAYDNLMMVTTPLAAPPPPVKTSYYYILALQWQPSQCLSRQCKRDFKPSDSFTIHGLWPNWENGDSPQHCFPDNKFQFKEIKDISLALDKAWPSLFEAKTQQAFLGNEWAKHGTSSGLTQFDYFNTALILTTQSLDVNVLNRLQQIGVTPGLNKKYDPSKIVRDYQTKWKQVIKIICIKKKGSSTEEMIGEIYFKVNKDGVTVESIGGATTSRCTQKSVLFPDRRTA